MGMILDSLLSLPPRTLSQAFAGTHAAVCQQTTALTSLPAMSYAFAAWLVFMASLQFLLLPCANC